jgi:hypothetical protein
MGLRFVSGIKRSPMESRWHRISRHACMHAFLYGKGNENREFVQEFFLEKKILFTVKRVEFVSDRMSYIILRVRWCHIIALNVHVPRGNKINDVKDSFNKNWNTYSTNSLNALRNLC